MNTLNNDKTNITDISIFIYTKHNQQILLLLGKQNNTPFNKTDVGLFSEFSGKIMNEESIKQATSRIIFEKTMNLIMELEELEKIIVSLPYVVDSQNKRIIFAFEIPYDEYANIPKYYNRVFTYLNMCTSSNSFGNTYIDSCPIGFLEKSELKWFNFDEIKKEDIFNINFYKNLIQIINKIMH